MDQPSPNPPEGLRARKLRETRARIADTALSLFLQRGFDGVTIDEIAATADISKPTFFNYFRAKEDVVLAWQDRFAIALADAVQARPMEEPLAAMLDAAMADALEATATPESFAITELVRSTPALAARNQAKYVQLEGKLADAISRRSPDLDKLQIRLLAMIVIGTLRVGTDEWHQDGTHDDSEVIDYSREIFRRFWAMVDVVTPQRLGL